MESVDLLLSIAEATRQRDLYEGDLTDEERAAGLDEVAADLTAAGAPPRLVDGAIAGWRAFRTVRRMAVEATELAQATIDAIERQQAKNLDLEERMSEQRDEYASLETTARSAEQQILQLADNYEHMVKETLGRFQQLDERYQDLLVERATLMDVIVQTAGLDQEQLKRVLRNAPEHGFSADLASELLAALDAAG